MITNFVLRLFVNGRKGEDKQLYKAVNHECFNDQVSWLFKKTGTLNSGRQPYRQTDSRVLSPVTFEYSVSKNQLLHIGRYNDVFVAISRPRGCFRRG